jgi:hypothetical protein
MGAACASETSAISPTFTWCKDPGSEQTWTILCSVTVGRLRFHKKRIRKIVRKVHLPKLVIGEEREFSRREFNLVIWYVLEIYLLLFDLYYSGPVTVAALSKAWIVFARSDTGIVGSNPTQGMAVCVRLFCVCVVLCLGSGLATGWSLVQGVLLSMKNDHGTE